MAESVNPFAGLERKRLPGMHLSTAREGGMPLHNALAAHFFMMLHNRVKHECLIEKALKDQKERVQQVVNRAKPEGATLPEVFGLMGAASLALEEWSYLDENDVHVFYLIADAAVEQVQRWIAEGSHMPYKLPLLGGEIVQRPQWAAEYFGTPDSENRKEARKYVEKLLTEVEATTQPS